MLTWWESLTVLEHVLLYIAVPATLILIIQTILLFVGGAIGGDADGGDVDGADGSIDADVHDICHDCGELHDMGLHAEDLHNGEFRGGDSNDGDTHENAASGLHVLTIRGVVAFFTLFSWGGLWLLQVGLHPLLALFLAVQIGIIGMVGIALLLREATKLQYDGTLDMRNAVGQTGTVYLTVPAHRAGVGKINVLVQEQLREFEAVTDGDSPLPYGASILVVRLLDDAVLLVDAT